ncbi:MAG: ATP-binding protein [Bacteroides sp.]|nr:ATP-binding protein [Bacteroides sp.]
MRLPAKIVCSANGTLQFEIRYQERPYRVKLYKFQENFNDGQEIDVAMTTQANGQLFFRQDLKALMSQFYDQGELYEFTVKHDFSYNGYYELIDERGLPFRLVVPRNLRLLTGTVVRCRVTGLDAAGCQLKLEGAESAERKVAPYLKQDYTPAQSVELDADSLAAIITEDLYKDAAPEFDLRELLSLLFINDDYFDLTVNRRLLAIIRQWNADGLDWDSINRRLLDFRRDIMYVLEGSRILLKEEEQRRKSLQQRLSLLANNVSGYHRAAEKLAGGDAIDKVNRVLHSLSTAGYVYEAERQLDMMMRIFSLSREFTDRHMCEVFKIIHNPERTESFWRNEPFRKAFIRLLQNYIEQCREATEGDAGYTDANVRSLLEALSIQLLLADREADADVFDYNLNLSTLYRYASLLPTAVPANGIRNSFLALMDVTRNLNGIYLWNETNAHDLLASKLTASGVGLEGFDKWYNFRKASLNLTDSGLTLMRNDVNRDTLKSLELKDVGVWPNLRILTPEKISTHESDLRRIGDMWNAIEKQLFSEERVAPVGSSAARKLTPEKDDECFIRVTRMLDDGLFAAEITNDDQFEGHGVIAADDMVKYKLPRLDVSHFCNKDGAPYVFLAKVKKVEDGVLHFSTFEYFVDYTHEEIRNNDVLRCIIKSSNQYGLVGVSERGDSVRFKREGIGATLKTGAQVHASYWTLPDKLESPYIDGAITEVIESAPYFDTEAAFRTLLADYSCHEVYEEPADTRESNEILTGEDMLSDNRLTEMMVLVERRAALESNYTKAYNHIAFARLLARMTRDDKRREFYETWMRLISILHFFAVNGRIDDTMLAEFEANDRSRFDTRSELYRRYLQLKIVSYKGLSGKEEELWRYMSDGDADARGLASYVLAYNIMANTASASALGEIDDRINNLLHVQGRKSTLHHFGAEDKTHEFKTSLIFPPNNHMRPNPEVQSKEIMKELCALLNADGGTLYLGVNDYGMGVGIENDLSYKDFNGSEDKYDLYFHKAVCTILGRDVDAYVNGRFETKGGKRIYTVEVKPYYAAPVMVDGIIYERHGSSKLPFHDPEDIRRFKERRNEERLAHSSATAQARAAAEETAPATPATTSATAPAKSTPARTAPAPAFNPEKIATRHTRPVCPASFEADPSVIRYLQLLREEFMMIPEFYGYSDDDKETLLTLPLTEEDERKYLVLGYADGTVAAVPMKLLFDKEDYQAGKRFTDAQLIFADILSDSEALMTISDNKKGNIFIRADYPAGLCQTGGMRQGGERLFNTQQVSYRYDVIDELKRLKYSDLFGRNAKDCGKPVDLTGRDRVAADLVRDGFISL